MDKKNQIRKEIIEKVREYYDVAFAQGHPFVEGESPINYDGRVFSEEELINLTNATLEFWLTAGRFSREFEIALAEYLNIKWALLVNSGSSANLLAFMALTSPLLKERRIKRGDEVITVAAAFPTTIAPIVQYGAVPVFVDVEANGANIDFTQLTQALSSRTKAVMLAHTLGNPFNIDNVLGFCSDNDLCLIEDNCDSLGSLYRARHTGTWGDIGTSSFYPSHQITTGEGGAVYTNNPLLKKILLSMRDWGRDCWCGSGQDDTCRNRFKKQYGTLPPGYDHKYVYSHWGYNLKATDLQAAVGLAQLKKLPDFVKRRQENYKYLFESLQELREFFILPTPCENSEPSWFGFLIIVRKGAPFKRNDIVEYLESAKIQTRNLFAGNITRQPCIVENNDFLFHVISDLPNTEFVLENGFWIGVYPGMTRDMLSYMTSQIKEFLYERQLFQRNL